MAAYRQVDGLVTCGLTACTLGSAPGQTLANKYWKTLPFLLFYSITWSRYAGITCFRHNNASEKFGIRETQHHLKGLKINFATLLMC